MKEPTIYLTIASLLIAANGPSPTAAVYKNICRLCANNVKLGNPHDCGSYIVCTDSVAVPFSCPSGQLFSVDQGKCVASTAVDCKDPCAPDINERWVSDPLSCSGYYYCRNGTGTHGVCPNDLHYDEDKQQCVYETDSKCAGDNYCHIIPNGINFKNEKACDKYNSCKKGVLTSTKCSSNMIYNRETAKCVDITTMDGCESMTTDICVKSTKPIKNKFVEDKVTCRGYYYCADNGKLPDANPFWGQCPMGLFFSYNDQSCVHPSDVKCDGNRCEGRPDGFVNSGTDCTHYLVCKNGKQIAEEICPQHRFFDEKRQACTSELITYKACTK